jgi:alanine racemase
MTAFIRPTWVELDLSAMRHNIRLARKLAGPGTRLYAVCKGDSYGVGAAETARVAAEEGCEAVAVGDPADALAIRAAGVALPILAYGTTDPATAPEMARLRVTVTLHDKEGIAAYAASGQKVAAMAELDCGFGRLGFTPDAWTAALPRLLKATNIRLTGLYTHLGATEDRALLDRQMARFQAGAGEAEAAGFTGLEKMVASSRVMIDHPGLALDAVNPGRLIYGLLESPYAERAGSRPVISRVVSRLIQVKDIAAGERIGYGAPGAAGNDRAIRAGIAPIGFAGGLPRRFEGGSVLVRGKRAPIVGLASMEHLLLDIGAIADAVPGDEVVLLGSQGDDAITGEELARVTGLEILELLPRLARTLPRRYLDPSYLERG